MIFKLQDAVDANGLVGQFIYEDIGWMHILKGDAVGGVIHALTIPIVAKALRECQLTHCSTSRS